MAPNWNLAYAVVPRVAAAFSIIGSSMIAHDVLKDATKRSRVYHRIILGMSCFDIIGSICYFLGRWPMPPDGLEGFGLTGGIGTQQTCTAQAFFGQAVVGIVTYNTVLAVQYFMVVNLGMYESNIKRYEVIFHAIPFLMWMVTCIVGLSFEVLNPAFFNCWISPVPINCAAKGEIPYGRPTCTRGYLAPVFQWGIFYGPIWAMIIIVTCIMISVYTKVRKMEKKSRRYSINETTTEATKRSRMVATQGLWYLLPFYATWVFPVVTEITEMVTAKYFDPMVILVAFFLPFQGALNFIIYMRPRYLKYRKKHPEWSIWYTVSRTVRKAACCITKDDESMLTSISQAGGSIRSMRRDSMRSIRSSIRSSYHDSREGSIEQDNRKSDPDITESPEPKRNVVKFADNVSEEQKIEEGATED